MNYFSRNRGLWIAIGVLILINLGSMVWMYRFHGRMIRHDRFKEHPRHEELIKRELGLSKEQRKLFKEVQKAHRQKIKAQQEELRAMKSKLRAMAMAESYQADADSLYNDIGKLQADIERSNFEHLKEMYQGLDPEQQKKFRRMIDKMSREKEKTAKGKPRRP